jgi:hypothetical protein
MMAAPGSTLRTRDQSKSVDGFCGSPASRVASRIVLSRRGLAAVSVVTHVAETNATMNFIDSPGTLRFCSLLGNVKSESRLVHGDSMRWRRGEAG